MSQAFSTRFSVLLVSALVLGSITCSRERAVDPERYYDRASGFSIKYPESWSIIEGHSEDEPLVEGLSPWEDDYDEFAEHVTVDVELVEAGTSLEAYFHETIEAQAAEIPGFQLTEQARMKIDGEDAIWIVFSLESEGGMITVLAYTMIRGERGYLVSCVAQATKFGSYRPLFEEVARTFRFE
jgi:hypothetical protein